MEIDKSAFDRAVSMAGKPNSQNWHWEVVKHYQTLCGHMSGGPGYEMVKRTNFAGRDYWDTIQTPRSRQWEREAAERGAVLRQALSLLEAP